MGIYNDFDYPPDFDEWQCRLLDEAASLFDFSDEEQFDEIVKAIRDNRVDFIEGATDEYDVGYENREVTGVAPNFEFFFDWEKFGNAIIADYAGNSGFTSGGWLGVR